MTAVNNKLLKPYWFPREVGLGFGVTAFSVDDAVKLLNQAGIHLEQENPDVIEDVDIASLDANHVLPNSGPITFRGVWYPRLNV